MITDMNMNIIIIVISIHGHQNWYGRYGTCQTNIPESSIKKFSPAFVHMII